MKTNKQTKIYYIKLYIIGLIGFIAGIGILGTVDTMNKFSTSRTAIQCSILTAIILCCYLIGRRIKRNADL